MITDLPISAGMTGRYPTKAGGFRVRITNAAPDPRRQPGYVLCDVLVSQDTQFAFGESVLVPASGIVVDEIGCAPKPYLQDTNGVWHKRDAQCGNQASFNTVTEKDQVSGYALLCACVEDEPAARGLHSAYRPSRA